MTTADEESEVQENVVSTLNRKILTCVVLVSLHNRRFMSHVRRTRRLSRFAIFSRSAQSAPFASLASYSVCYAG